MDSEVLAVGINVNIKRTDGRVHQAVVSDVNGDTQCVTVEWYEKGEAKGKEIDFNSIFEFNKNIKPPSNMSSDVKKRPEKIQQPRPDSKLPVSSRANLRSSVDLDANKPTSAIPVNASIELNGNSKILQNVEYRPKKSRSKEREKPGRISSSYESVNDLDNTVLNNNKHKTQGDWSAGNVSEEDVTVMELEKLAHATSKELLDKTVGGNSKIKKMGSKLPAPTQPDPSGSRKSATVREIEKIQLRREERRAAQKNARDQQPELDQSNPNFEILQMIQEFQSQIEYSPLSANDEVEKHQICVCIRKRPMNKKEMGRKEIDVVTVPHKDIVIVHEPKVKVDLTKYLENQQFRVDYAFDESADNNLVYKYTARPLVESIFERGMATCFAYGQTGSGKTHTMGGEFSAKSTQNCNNGIYALAARDVFYLNEHKYFDDDLHIEAAFFEIYGGKVFDLLNKKLKLRVLEDGKQQVQVVGLRTEPVHCVEDVLQLLQHGTHIRTSGQTAANSHSSRSHAVFQLILKKDNKLYGKFSLIDLAGNERGADTSSSDRVTRLEGAEINKSLLALKECIRALGRKGAHLPFRASKLTQVLRDSFIGDRSRTCMIAMISPGKESCEHTLNTLRYADRVKELGPNGGGGVNDWNSPAIGAKGSNVITTTTNMTSGGRPASTISKVNPTNASAEFRHRQLNSIEGDVEEDDEMAILRSDDNGDIPEDMYNFHRVIKDVELTEDEVCDMYKAFCIKMTTWTKSHYKLSRVLNEVDFDADKFIKELSSNITHQVSELNSLQEKLNVWNKQLKEEEEICMKMSSKNRK